MLVNLQVSHSELSDRVEYLLYGYSGKRAPDKVEILYGNGELFKTLGKTNPYKVKSFNFLISFYESRKELERKLREKGKTENLIFVNSCTKTQNNKYENNDAELRFSLHWIFLC